MDWIKCREKVPEENHCSFLVSDGSFVTIAYWDVDDFVGCENDLLKKVEYWMPFPDAPKDEK